MHPAPHSQFDDFSNMGSVGVRRWSTASEADDTPQHTSTSQMGHADLSHATPLSDFKSTDSTVEQLLAQTPSYVHTQYAGKPHLNTEEFCALLRQESYDVDECIYEAASWQQERKFQDWVEDVVDEMKDKGILRKPGMFECTLFTVSTIGAVAGWVAGGPIGSVIGSKTASAAVTAGFGVKKLADKYVQKLANKEQPVPVFELSQNASADSLLAQPDFSSEDKISMSKFEVDHWTGDAWSTPAYPPTAK